MVSGSGDGRGEEGKGQEGKVGKEKGNYERREMEGMG